MMLSLLIAIHELGHLAMAKLFKVYCFEYALGFGPKLFSKKRKNGETYFSIRAIPFGGFVSMYGESESVPEGLTIDPSRSLLAIKKWKRALILVAGVVMNFILALAMFFVYNVAFPVYQPRYGHTTIARNSIAAEKGLKSKDQVHSELLVYNGEAFVFYDSLGLVEYDSGDPIFAYFGYNLSTLTLKDMSVRNHTVAYETKTFGNVESTDYSETISINDINTLETVTETIYKVEGYLCNATGKKDGANYKITLSLIQNSYDDKTTAVKCDVTFSKEEFETFSLVPLNEKVTVTGTFKDSDGIKSINVNKYEMNYPNMKGDNLLTTKKGGLEPKALSFDMYKQNENPDPGKGTALDFDHLELTRSGSTYYLPKNFGVNVQLDENWNTFGQSIVNTFTDFGDSSVVIFKGLATLVTTADGWKQVSGLIGIGVVSTQVLENAGFSRFLFLWAMISVNLGIVNLLPFPGLDGWQLLVLGVEAIFRKEIPAKVKNIVSAVGVLLLLGLMILILIKDIFTFF